MNLIAVQLAAVNDNATPLPVKAPKASRVITVRDIPQKPSKRFVRQPAIGQHADIVPGESIRLYGCKSDRYVRDASTGKMVPGSVNYDLTFRVGDVAAYGGYNLTYTGTIVAIGEKTVSVKYGREVHRLDLHTFSDENWDFDAAAIEKRNAEWMD